MGPPQFVLPALALALALLAPRALSSEEFSEELLLRPLRDGRLLAHFHFRASTDAVSTSHLQHFPRAVEGIMREEGLEEWQLSFTRGRWLLGEWGASPSPAKTPGAELWARVRAGGDEQAAWRALTETLGSTFCASLGILGAPGGGVVSFPAFIAPVSVPGTGGSSGGGGAQGPQGNASHVWYGQLPQEAVCTENLSPWLKLLPCQDEAGLGVLLRARARLYRASFHSLSIYARRGATAAGDPPSTEVVQMLSLVLQPGGGGGSRSWSLSSLLGAPLRGRCPAAASSEVYVEDRGGGGGPSSGRGGGGAFSITPPPDGSLARGDASSAARLLRYSLDRAAGDLDISVDWGGEGPAAAPSPPPPVLASSYWVGSTGLDATMVVEVLPQQQAPGIPPPPLEVCVLQALPWFMRMWISTLKLTVDGVVVPLQARKLRYAPSEDSHRSPSQIELCIDLPLGARRALLSFACDKGFLHFTEHPPDANRGFDIPGALVQARVAGGAQEAPLPWEPAGAGGETADGAELLPLLRMLGGAPHGQLHTSGLLVSVPTPDFSMPYNVCTLTCTVVALYMGALLQVITRRPGQPPGPAAGLLARFKAALRRRFGRTL